MRKKIVALGISLSLVVAAASVALAAEKQTQDRPVEGKITPWQAIKIAQHRVPGKALNAIYEFDEGHWVYGVMIVHNKKISEVEIDPVSGKIGDVEGVTPAGEAKEFQEELARAIR